MNTDTNNKHNTDDSNALSAGGEGRVRWSPDHQPSTLNPQLVYAYTRSQAIADGFQIEVTKTAEEAGIRFPVFITRGVYEQCVAVPPGVTAQEIGRAHV